MIDCVYMVISGGLPKTTWLGLGMTSDWERCYGTALGSVYKDFQLNSSTPFFPDASLFPLWPEPITKPGQEESAVYKLW